jgi:hypothetical protein
VSQDLLHRNTTLTIDVCIDRVHTRTIGERLTAQITTLTWPTSHRCQPSTDFNCEVARRVYERFRISSDCCQFFDPFVPVPTAVVTAATVRYASRMGFNSFAPVTRVSPVNPRWQGRFVKILELSGVTRVMADGTDEDGALAARMHESVA